MQLIPRDTFNHLLGQIFSGLDSEDSGMNGFFSPSVDIEEADGAYVLTADLPGVKKEDISIELDHDLLTLRAERSQEKEEKKKGRVIRRERHSGSFARSFSVGPDVSVKDIKASFSNGLLTLTIPRVQSVTQSGHRIEIQ